MYSVYAALGHKFPVVTPKETLERSNHLVFVKWLVSSGRVSDWTPKEAEDLLLSSKPRPE